MPFKQFPDANSCALAAEAVGRLYATSVARPWPIPPDTYGPGRQPQPPAAYYQKYYQGPREAIAANPALGITNPLPIRIEADGFCVSQHGKVVSTTGGNVTLDFSGLTADPATT